MKNFLRLVCKISVLIISLNILLTTFTVFLEEDTFKQNNESNYIDQS